MPYLAESVEPNADFTEWTITLRDGITFHDGTRSERRRGEANLDEYRGADGAPNSGPLLTIVFQSSPATGRRSAEVTVR